MLSAAAALGRTGARGIGMIGGDVVPAREEPMVAREVLGERLGLILHTGAAPMAVHLLQPDDVAALKRFGNPG